MFLMKNYELLLVTNVLQFLLKCNDDSLKNDRFGDYWK